MLAHYLPQQLTQDEIAAIVADAIASTGAVELGMKGMGKVMALVTPQTKGKADGSVVAAGSGVSCPVEPGESRAFETLLGPSTGPTAKFPYLRGGKIGGNVGGGGTGFCCCCCFFFCC